MREHVKIGAALFAVSAARTLKSSDGHSLAGQIDYNRHTIRLYDRLDNQQAWETLWHEVVHGIADFMDVDVTEEEVGRLANGLTLVLADNPGLERPDEEDV